jgi:microcystin-dependent protein
MDAFIGTIIAVGFNFAPRGWVLCQGQIMSIAQNTALFSLLGTTYGGDGQTTFALPNLCGRTLVGQGQGQGLQNVALGQVWGSDNAEVSVSGTGSVTLGAANLPKHTHPVTIAGDGFSATSTLNATTTGSGAGEPTEGAALGGTGLGRSGIYVSAAAPDVALNAGSVSTKVGGQVETATGDNNGNGEPFPMPFRAVVNASVVQPSLGINYCICVEGIFPPRN